MFKNNFKQLPYKLPICSGSINGVFQYTPERNVSCSFRCFSGTTEIDGSLQIQITGKHWFGHVNMKAICNAQLQPLIDL
jgi:hypothetical protein